MDMFFADISSITRSSLLRLETGIHGLQTKLRDLQNEQKKTVLALDRRSIKEDTTIQSLRSAIGGLQAVQHQSEAAQDQRLTSYETAVHEPIARLLEAQQRLELKLDAVEATSVARAAQRTTGRVMQPESSGHTQFTHSLCISASISQARCSDGCICICHHRQNRQTPEFLTRFFGTLFIGYTGLPLIIQPCDIHTCIQRTSPTIIITYFFPLWLLARALFLVIKLSSCDGPHVSLRVPRIRTDNSVIFTFSSLGNVNGVKQVLQQRLGSPFDVVDFDGFSALMVSMVPCMKYDNVLIQFLAISQFRLDVCELLLKVGADPYQEDFNHRYFLNFNMLEGY